MIDIFTLAFGKPRPFHSFWLNHLQHLPCQFHLLTDSEDEWTSITKGKPMNVSVHHVTIQNYFEAVAQCMQCDTADKLLQLHGGYFFERFDGWTACGFRPLLPAMFPRLVTKDLFGWIDFDVLLNRSLFEMVNTESALFPKADTLFIPQGIRWEQFKVCRMSAVAAIVEEIREGMATKQFPRGTPVEAQFVYSKRRLQHRVYSATSQSQIAVHWQYLDNIGEESRPNQLDVRFDNLTHTLTEANTGSNILMFIADKECKQFSSSDVALLTQQQAVHFPYF